jgi:protein involved in polysaccharide export with SLBB domain
LLHFGSSADTGHVLHRKAGQTARIVPVSEAAGIALADNDVVTVQYLENSGTQDTVMVSGEAKRPGTYPIDLGKTTARDLIEFAGGATAAASMKRAFIIRAGKLIPPGATYLPSGANSAPLAPRYPTSGSPIVRPEISASLTDVAVNGDYAVIRFDELPPDSVKLENGDELHIPRKEDFVYISGYVRSPGAYPYRDGEGLSHYIGLADGYTPKADKANVVVMRYYNGIAQVRDAESIEEGDVIVVPASVEFKRMTSVYLPLVQTMAAIASLVLTYVAVMRSR